DGGLEDRKGATRVRAVLQLESVEVSRREREVAQLVGDEAAVVVARRQLRAQEAREVRGRQGDRPPWLDHVRIAACLEHPSEAGPAGVVERLGEEARRDG